MKDDVNIGSLANDAYAQHLGVTLYSMLANCSDTKRLRLFIPLEHVKKLVNERELDWNKIEKNVLAYKGPNLGLVVEKPKLPIIESAELFEIITHLIADGSVNKNGIAMYTNSNQELINNFQKLVREVFGDTKNKVYKRESKVYQCTISKVFPDIIKSFYDINFYSKTAKFPERLFELPQEHSYAVVRAIVDDEGSVGDNRISIKMKNKELMRQIERILIRIFDKKAVSSLVRRKDGCWEISIKSNYLKQFDRKIGMIHPRKKEDIGYAIKRSEYREIKNKGFRWETKIRILTGIADKPTTVKNLGKRLLVSRFNIRAHINELEKISLIKKEKYERSFKYGLTEEGKNFLKEKVPSFNRIQVGTKEMACNNLKKGSRVLLNNESRERLFWFLERTLSNQSRIGDMFKMHHNTISNWKTGKTLIPSKDLNKMLSFLAKKGIDLSKGIGAHIEDIKTLNGKYKKQGGIRNDLCVHSTAAS